MKGKAITSRLAQLLEDSIPVKHVSTNGELWSDETLHKNKDNTVVNRTTTTTTHDISTTKQRVENYKSNKDNFKQLYKERLLGVEQIVPLEQHQHTPPIDTQQTSKKRGRLDTNYINNPHITPTTYHLNNILKAQDIQPGFVHTLTKINSKTSALREHIDGVNTMDTVTMDELQVEVDEVNRLVRDYNLAVGVSQQRFKLVLSDELEKSVVRCSSREAVDAVESVKAVKQKTPSFWGLFK